jgi:DNA-binding NarL/FixJ family response regulator
MPRILIIEDDPQLRANVVDILEMEGYQVLAAAHGREGVEVARREMPELVLCDIMMPEMDGHAVLQTLRADDSTARIPFVFLTARGEHAHVRTGMNLGADDYLIKPVRLDDLLAAIEARLERSRQYGGFKADFNTAKPLEALGLTPREAEILLWVAQGKTNAETGMILNITLATVKKHLENIYQKLRVESRNSATLRALEVLSR